MRAISRFALLRSFNADAGSTPVVPYAGLILLEGDEQSGADVLLLEGDEQSGTDALDLEGNE